MLSKRSNQSNQKTALEIIQSREIIPRNEWCQLFFPRFKPATDIGKSKLTNNLPDCYHVQYLLDNFV